MMMIHVVPFRKLKKQQNRMLFSYIDIHKHQAFTLFIHRFVNNACKFLSHFSIY